MILTSYASWWQLLLCLTIAVALSTAIGFERQLKRKSAGMRTHTLVGLGAALFMVVSKYGFADVERAGLVTLDPSRMAAQIVSGIGFIGAGLVFVRRNKVRGLTTAASIWLTAAIGSAAGAGLVVPAVFVTAVHFLVAGLYPAIVRRTRLGTSRQHLIKVRYNDGVGALRDIMATCTSLGYAVHGVETQPASVTTHPILHRNETTHVPEDPRQIDVDLEVEGAAPVSYLVSHLTDLAGVSAVRIDEDSE